MEDSMKKLILLVLFINSLITKAEKVGCPGIPVLCQFKMNEWANFDLLPSLRNLNKLIKERLSKIVNIKKLMTTEKFKDVIHKNAQLLLQELEAPTLYKKSLQKLAQDPERIAEVKKITNAVQGIINAYDYIGQRGILNLGPLYDALNKYNPILEQAEKELNHSRKANFEILVPTKKPDCTEFLINPKILCMGYAAFTEPVWIDLDTCTYQIHPIQKQSGEYEQKLFKSKIEEPGSTFEKATKSPAAATFEEVTTKGKIG